MVYLVEKFRVGGVGRNLNSTRPHLRVNETHSLNIELKMAMVKHGGSW